MKLTRIGKQPPRIDRALARALAPMIATIRATLPSVRTPADSRALGAAIRKRWTDKVIRAAVRSSIVAAEAAASRPWRSIDRALAKRDGKRDAAEYDGTDLIERWVTQTVKHITSVRDDALDTMHRDIVAAYDRGDDPQALAAKWRADGIPLRFGTLEGRTQVIAQHQLTSLHAQVQRERAGAIGATEFVWRTQGDARVRDAHAALDGRTLTYADGAPGEGLPGEPVNCRCWAETVIDPELLADLGLAVL